MHRKHMDMRDVYSEKKRENSRERQRGNKKEIIKKHFDIESKKKLINIKIINTKKARKKHNDSMALGSIRKRI